MSKFTKKSILFLAVLMAMTMSSAKAQVFIADNEVEGLSRQADGEYVLVVPYVGSESDQYAPLGEGVLLLMGLGGAYLLKKAKKKEEAE